MKYSDFKNKVRHYPIFRSNIFGHISQNTNQLRSQMTQWVQKDHVIPLKRGLYTLNESDRQANFSRSFLANQLCTPSYISLETALSYYGLIPEGVFATTSITTKKTQTFKNIYGEFTYSHVKLPLYTHFIQKQDEFNNTFLIATPEKALIDFFYFKTRFIQTVEKSLFEDSYRLQNLESINPKLLFSIAEMIGQKKLLNTIEKFITYMEETHD